MQFKSAASGVCVIWLLLVFGCTSFPSYEGKSRDGQGDLERITSSGRSKHSRAQLVSMMDSFSEGQYCRFIFSESGDRPKGGPPRDLFPFDPRMLGIQPTVKMGGRVVWTTDKGMYLEDVVQIFDPPASVFGKPKKIAIVRTPDQSEGFFQWEHIRQAESMEPDEWMTYCESAIEYSSVEAAYGVPSRRE